MIGFHLTLAWRDLRRTPAFNAVMLGALVLAVAGWYVPHQIFLLLDRVPLEHRTSVYGVGIDRPRTRYAMPVSDSPFARLLPTILLTGREALALSDSDAPRRQTLTFISGETAHVDGQAPIPVRTRFANRDLFEMFEIPFEAGGPWSIAADDGGLAGGERADEVVIAAHLARKLFPREPAVGQRMRLAGVDVRVVGVIDESYRNALRIYDPWSFDTPVSDVHISIAAAARLGAAPTFVITGGPRKDDFASLLASDDRWLLQWVELGSATERRAFEDHVHAWLHDDGDTAATLHLRSIPEWRKEVMQIQGTARTWPILANLALIVCLLNLMRLLMAKFAGRGLDLGVLRAFGARRGSIVAQLLLQAAMIGTAAGVLGTLIGAALVPSARRALGALGDVVAFSFSDLLLTVALSVAIAVASAAYPAWRLARASPASHLRRS